MIATIRDARNGVVYANNGASGYTIQNGEAGRICGATAVNADAISMELGDSAEGFVFNHGRIVGTGEAVGNGQAELHERAADREVRQRPHVATVAGR